jgi:microsomal prostaglandin-E synthase 2
MLYAQHARRASRFQALSRRLSSTTALAKDPDQPLVKLYQYSICPFCHRSKALLAYSHTDYSAVEVNPITRKEIRWYANSLMLRDAHRIDSALVCG